MAKKKQRGGIPKAQNAIPGGIPPTPILGNNMIMTTPTGRPQEDLLRMRLMEERDKKIRLAEEKARVDERKAAVATMDKNKAFPLPTGESKKWKKMNVKEKAYVAGKALENRGRIFEGEESGVDTGLNPLNWLGSMAGALGQAPLQSEVSGSYLPYVGAVANLLLAGRFASTSSFNPVSKQFWTETLPSGRFADNLLVGYPNLAGSAMKTIGTPGEIASVVGKLPGLTSAAVSRLTPKGKPLTKKEERMLEGIRNIGKINAENPDSYGNFGRAANLETLRGILNNGKNVPDENFKKLIGYTKSQVKNRIKELEKAGPSAQPQQQVSPITSAEIRNAFDQALRDVLPEDLPPPPDMVTLPDDVLRDMMQAAQTAPSRSTKDKIKQGIKNAPSNLKQRFNQGLAEIATAPRLLKNDLSNLNDALQMRAFNLRNKYIQSQFPISPSLAPLVSRGHYVELRDNFGRQVNDALSSLSDNEIRDVARKQPDFVQFLNDDLTDASYLRYLLRSRATDNFENLLFASGTPSGRWAQAKEFYRNLPRLDYERNPAVVQDLILGNVPTTNTTSSIFENILNPSGKPSYAKRLGNLLDEKTMQLEGVPVSTNFSYNLPRDTKSLKPTLYAGPQTSTTREIKEAIQRIIDAPKGQQMITAGSLSSDSYNRLTLDVAKKMQKKGIIDIKFRGYNTLNSSGFPTQAGLSSKLILKEMNSKIKELNKGLKDKLPYAMKDQYGNIQYPVMSWERLKLGGNVKKAQVGTITPPGAFGTPQGTAEALGIATEVLSAPQKGLTQLFTGKYQTPSEAMGVTNPYGAFGIDAILDPLNVVGAGLIKSFLKKAPVKSASKYKPTIFAHETDKARRTKMADMYMGANLDDAQRAGYLYPTRSSTAAPPGTFESFLNTANNAGSMEMRDGLLQKPSSSFKPLTNPSYLFKGILPNRDGGSIASRMGGLTDKGFNYNPAWGGRWRMGGTLPGASGFMYARTGAPSNGPYAKKTKASAKNGMSFYQNGLDWKPRNISQDGITIDPDGYWNPDNWGEPVMIPSNEITMQGVDQPLLGISDTGDVQMMYPGEDYTFDGESVTEYPVAKNGAKADPVPKKAPVKYPKRVVVFAEAPASADLDANNNIVGKLQSPFIQEANNLKSFYKRVSPSTKVEVYPIYGYAEREMKYIPKIKGFKNETQLEAYERASKIMSTLGEDDDVAIFGHHGSRFAGIPISDWRDMLVNSKYGNCYLGSCYSEDVMVKGWPDVKNVYYRPNKSWFGVNPNASTILDAMYSRSVTDYNSNQPNLVEGEPYSRVRIVKPKPGTDYQGWNVGSKANTLFPREEKPTTYFGGSDSTDTMSILSPTERLIRYMEMNRPGGISLKSQLEQKLATMQSSMMGAPPQYVPGRTTQRREGGQLKKLDQLTNFTNYNKMAKKGKKLKKAAVGDYIGGESSTFEPMQFRDIYDYYDKTITGKTDEERQQEMLLKQSLQQPTGNEQGGQGQTQDNKNNNLGKDGDGYDNLRQMYKQYKSKGDINISNADQYLQQAKDYRRASTPGFFQGIGEFAPTLFSLFEPAKRGKNLPKAQVGDSVFGTVQNIGQDAADYKKAMRIFGQAEAMNQISGALPVVGDIIGGFQKVQQAVNERRKAKQFKELSALSAKAAATRPEPTRRMYVRPEDSLTDPGQVYPTLGVGTNYLQMQDGGQVMNQIGGNPTEIMNMYNPGDLYTNLGYEPFGESLPVKQYQRGGKAQDGMSLIGQGINLAGNLVSGIMGIGTKRITNQAKQNLAQTAFQQGMVGVQNQYAPFMEHGGYMSHDWQPQVITQFGPHKMSDLLRPDNQSDIMRAGGPVRDIRSNYMGNDEYMGMMKMGGSLGTHWGGGTELMSYNPYMPGSGETHMVRGQSHEESDGRGNTGVGISYGENMVEAERGEPIVEMEEGGKMGDTSAVIYGNLKIPAYGVSELEDPKAKGKKFKHYVADLSKGEVKANKKMMKAVEMLDNAKTSSPFDRLTMNSAKMMMQGADQKLREIAQKKRIAAGVQNAILETAEEQGLDSDALAKGKLKKAKPENEAKMGKRIPKAQNSRTIPYKDDFVGPLDYTDELEPEYSYRPAEYPLPTFKSPVNMDFYMSQVMPYASVGKDEDKKKKSTVIDTLNKILGTAMPYLRPTNQEELDPSQLTPEMTALAMNQLEPVSAQTYQPMLTQVSRIATAQPKINEINAQFNAVSRLFGNNPQVQSMLSAQKYAAISQAVGEEFAMNQQREDAIRAQNIATLNDATLKNLSILDQQFVRQAQAKSATKAQAIEALKSIADKIAKNKLENKTLGIYENLYNYRFGPRGVAYNINPPAEFSIPELAGLDPELQKKFSDLISEMEKDKKEKKSSTSTRNGSIVKAIKNL